MLAKFLSEPSTPEASAASLPPRLLQLLPAGATVAGQDSHLLKDSAFSRRTKMDLFSRHSEPFGRGEGRQQVAGAEMGQTAAQDGTGADTGQGLLVPELMAPQQG